MGVYSVLELENISISGLTKMKELHENDLWEKYYVSKPYPNRDRDIKETLKNLEISKRLIGKNLKSVPNKNPGKYIEG